MRLAQRLQIACFAGFVTLVGGCADDDDDSAPEHDHGHADAGEHHDSSQGAQRSMDAGDSDQRDKDTAETSESKSDEAKPDDAKTDAAKEDAGADAGKPDDAKADDAKPDEAKDSEPKPDTKTDKSGTYVLSVIVFTQDVNVTNTYVTLVDSLDVKEIDLKQGIEFGGQANVAVYNGRVYISDGEAPTIKRYRLTDDKKLAEDETVSFANFGVSSVSVDDTVNTFVSKTKAYLSGENGSTVVWNPDDMTITGEIPVELPDAKSMPVDMTLTGSSGFARGNKLYRTFFWFDWSSYAFSDAQYFVVYDTDKDAVISVEPETRCPSLGAQVSSDAKGTAYFSNWFYNLAGTLQKGRPSACVLRLAPDSDKLDADWTLDFTKLTGGHEGAQLSYTQNQQGVFAAFHEEEIAVKPDDSPYDVVAGPHWEAWQLDLGTQKAAPIKGIDRLGAQQTVFTLDGRTFLFAPNQDFDLTKVYEVTPDGNSRLAFEIKGWSRAFLKLK